MELIGITEKGDAALDLSWKPWVHIGKPAILITKDPRKLAKHLMPNDNVIVHCTITGYAEYKLEPNVPPIRIAVNGMGAISEIIGQDRVVLRIDPIIPTTRGVLRARHVLSQAQFGYDRIRISFLDNYTHVRDRFKAASLPDLDYSLHAPLEDRVRVLKDLQEVCSVPIEVCGEPGMKCTGCISDIDCKILGVEPSSSTSKQRKACACLSNKYELLKNKGQCFHKCLYCYWR